MYWWGKNITFLILLASISLQAQNFEHENMQTSKGFQKEFGILDRKIDKANGDFGVEEFLRQQRINRARDRGQDLVLAKILETHPIAVQNKDLVANLLTTMREGHNRVLLETTKFVDDQTIKDKSSKSSELLEMYKEVVNSRFYHFTPEHRANARLFIDGSKTVNAYSFTGYPQTLYYLGLVNDTTKEGLRSVMGHELGHAVSRHVDYSVEMYAYLLLGGYYMFDDRNELNSNRRNQTNPLLESFQSNINRMSTVDPKRVMSSDLNLFEKAAVQSFHHHAGEPGTEEYSERMGTYLRTVAELANKIFMRSQAGGQFAGLEQLIYSIESVIIDDQRVLKNLQSRINRGKKQYGAPLTRLSKLFSSVDVFFEQIHFGLMALTRSKERTADHYGLLLSGKAESMLVEAMFMSGELANVKEEMAQREVISREKAKNPQIHADEVSSWYRSHPTPLRRLENAEKFAESYQYKMLTNDFYIAFRDYLDLLELYGGSKEQIEEFKASRKEADEAFKKMIEVYTGLEEYLQGKRKTPPEGAEIEVDFKNEEEVRALLEELKLEKRSLKVQFDQAKADNKNDRTSFEEVLPEIEKATFRYADLVGSELGRIAKKQSSEDFSKTVNELGEMFEDWMRFNIAVEIEDMLEKHGMDRLLKEAKQSNPRETERLESKLYQIIDKYRNDDKQIRSYQDLVNAPKRLAAEKAKSSLSSIKSSMCSRTFSK